MILGRDILSVYKYHSKRSFHQELRLSNPIPIASVFSPAVPAKEQAIVSSNSTLPDVERPGTSSMATSVLDPEKERRNLILSGGSTSTQVSSVLDEERGESGNTSIGEEGEAKVVEPPAQDANEYPGGATLALIVVAIILSIFLASLDMVDDPYSSSTIVCRD